MFTKKLLIVFLTIVAALTTYFKFNTATHESFINYKLGAQPQVINRSGHSGSTAQQLQGYNIPFSNRGMGFQANLSPRLYGGQFGAQIQYNAPSLKHMALRPNDPMMLANNVEKPRVRENYQYNQNTGVANVSSSLQSQPLALPEGDMKSADIGKNVMTMDRVMYSPSQVRTRSQGDMIRGDLNITPVLTNGWFQTSQSLTPGQSLQTGALAVMGGAYNEAGRGVAALKQQALGSTTNIAGGIAFDTLPSTAIGGLYNSGSQYSLDTARLPATSVMSTATMP